MNVRELIEHIERGLERAESEEWCVLTLLADKDTEELLTDLKKAYEPTERSEG